MYFCDLFIVVMNSSSAPSSKLSKSLSVEATAGSDITSASGNNEVSYHFCSILILTIGIVEALGNKTKSERVQCAVYMYMYMSIVYSSVPICLVLILS